MILATAKVADFDRFWKTFSTKGAEKRKEHGSKGARVYRDPDDPSRVWAIFEWDEEGHHALMSDPEAPEIFKDAGLEGPPELVELAGEADS